MKYGLNGKLEATNGNGGKLAEILIRASQLVRGMDGCLLYMVSTDSENPDLVWITEVWEDKESHDASLKSEAVKSLIGEAMPILAEMPSGSVELKVLEGY